MKIKIPGAGLFSPSQETALVLERGGLEFTYRFDINSTETRIDVTLRNRSKDSIKLSTFTLLTIMDIPEPVYYNNWQSWLPFKAYWELPEVKGLIEFADKAGITLFNATPMPEVLRSNVRPSDYFFGSENLIAGFLDSKVSHPYFVWDDVDDIVDVHVELFGKELKPGESLELESLMIICDDSFPAMLERYAEKIKAEKDIDFKEFDGIGWCSWYQYYTDIDFEELKDNVEKLAELREKREIPFKYIQLDDGYQKDIGDWLETNDKFPTLKEIASFISSRGFIPGLWLAPYSVAETSDIFRDHQDWLVKDLSGKPKVAYINWNKKIYALDGSNPDVINHFEDLMKKLKEAGFEYIKIDFMYAGAMPGIRYEKSCTPIEAYIKGLKSIRSGLGNEVFLLGCGAPLLPSAGLVDGMRIGPDTSPAWNDNVMDMGIPSAKFALRSTLTRSFMHGRLWANDPDTLLLRSQDTDLTEKERNLYACACGLLNNMLLISDDLKKVSEKDMNTLDKAIELSGGRARVFLNGSNGIFVVGTKGGSNYNSLAVMNLTDSPKTVKIPEKAIEWTGVNPGSTDVQVQAHDLWIKKEPSRVRKLKKTVEYKDDGRQVNYFEEEK